MKTDAQLQRDVVEELQFEPSVEAAQIAVAAENGVVTLTGHVPVYAQKFTAENVAKRVHGVKAVANDIEVRMPGHGGHTDTDIATAALHTLKWDAAVPDDRVQVIVRDGWITLTGSLDWHFQKVAADRAVRNLIGAHGVTNSILVSPSEKATGIKRCVESALRRNANLDSEQIEVEEQGGTVMLCGDVHSCYEREEAERLAWAAPGVNAVENRLEITPW
jgi:osmotically-inducible protein OsmY